jgi:hypothetical protein
MPLLSFSPATSRLSTLGAALLVASLGTGCGDDDAAGSFDADGGVAEGEAGSDGGGSSQGGDASIPKDSGTPTAPFAVELGTAGSFVILSKSGVSTVPTSAVTGDVGVSPAAATYITGFSLTEDATNAFATSPQVTGKVFASDYAVPTPSNLTTAVSDMETAFLDAAGRAPKVTELGAGNIGGMTLTPGVYKWGTGLLIPSDVTLSGDATDVWVFQIAQDLTMASATKVILTGGALAKHVFWQVSGSADLDTTAHMEGTLMSQTSIALRKGASVNGRLLAQTAVTIDGSAVVQP